MSSLDSNEQIIYRDEAKKKKKFPSSRTCCSFDLIIESRCGDDVTGSPAKHPREGTKMFLRIKIRKKNQVAVNFLVYRFPVNKYFNVPLTRGLTDPVYFSHPLFFNYNFITDSFAEIFYNFSLLFFFIEISIENLSIYSFVLILKVRLEATFIRKYLFRINNSIWYFYNFYKNHVP